MQLLPYYEYCTTDKNLWSVIMKRLNLMQGVPVDCDQHAFFGCQFVGVPFICSVYYKVEPRLCFEVEFVSQVETA